jgi:16S rRNA (cytosine1402-N4)-methyltransferase
MYPKAKVLGIDLDQASLDKLSIVLAQEGLAQRTTLVQGNFKNIKAIAQDNSFVRVLGVVLDLGFSSAQLDDPGRGLSFQVAGPLDMRFDKSKNNTAEIIVNSYSLQQLAKIFKDYGEERLAHKIAAEIVRERSKKRISDTLELFEVIKQSLPKPVVYKASDYARRIFQALRIEVNDELNNLRKALPDVLDLLQPGGRMLVISFHSLEDRIVKGFFNEGAKGCICPPDFPTCVCGRNPLLKILTRKPVTATEQEIAENSRSRPAKLRVAQKI